MKNEAYFAAGCFWGVEQFFNSQKGVIDTEVGYMNGNEKDFPNPNYEQVCSNLTAYAETTKVIYDSEKIKYDELVELFFKIHDPTELNRQGPDVGDQYRSAIFYKTDEEKSIALKRISKEQKKLKGKKIATIVEKARTFFAAETYHQKYWKTHNVVCHIR